MTLGVAGEQASGGGERFVMADGGEGVGQFAGFRDGVIHAIGGEYRKMERAGKIDCNAVAGFFFAMEMALEFDVDILVTENSDEFVDCVARFFWTALFEGCCERAFVAAREADQAFGVFL